MARFALFVAVIALVMAIVAYQKASGPGGPQELKSVERALESMRKETADALSRIERSIRPEDRPEGAPAKPKP
jgi:hypothetical protein